VIDSFGGTFARIISGTNTNTSKDSSGRPLNLLVATGWSSARSTGTVSNAVTLWGLAPKLGSALCATYALSMKYDSGVSLTDIAQHNLGLVTKDSSGAWVNAVELNNGGSTTLSMGAWTALDTLGTWGVDTSTRTAWAVVNHGGTFVVSTLGNAGTRQSLCAARTPGVPPFCLKGKMLILNAGAHPITTVELFSLTGQLLRRVPASQPTLDLTPFTGRALIVRIAGAAEVTATLIVVP
jgi:hypothetical protein